MSTRDKILIGVGIVAVLGVLAFQALRAERGDRVEVRAEVVTRRDLVARVTASGHIEPKRSVDIQSDISGRIVRMPVEDGENVEKGDLLLEIDATQYEAALRQARARLSEARSREAQARADHLQAERDRERLEKLQERTPDLVTAQEVERARTQAEMRKAQWEAAKHAVQQAQAAVEEAEDRLDRTVIRAPMSGRITRLNVEEGETAIVGTMNNPGSLLLTVADLSVMEAVVEVDETDVTRVSVGDSASVEIDAFPNRRFAGRVTKIGNSSMQPRAGAGRGQDDAVDFEVRILLEDPPSGIRPDLSCTADVVTDRRGNALAIPIISLTLQDTADLPPGWRQDAHEAPTVDQEAVEGVFRITGEQVRFRPVRVGIAGDSYFEVAAGLSEGDTVVSGTYQAIRELEPGDRVETTRVAGAPEPRPGSEGGDGGGDGDRSPAGDGAAAGESGAPGSGGAAPAGEDTPGEAFYAVVASARDSSGIRRLLDRLSEEGHPTRMDLHRDEEGERWWRGLVGPFPSRAEADEAARTLSQREAVDAWVTDVSPGDA